MIAINELSATVELNETEAASTFGGRRLGNSPQARHTLAMIEWRNSGAGSQLPGRRSRSTFEQRVAYFQASQQYSNQVAAQLGLPANATIHPYYDPNHSSFGNTSYRRGRR